MCRSCHQEKGKTYAETAHHFASGWPSKRTMKGSFTPDSNVMKTANAFLTFEMTVTEQGYFQSAVEKVSPSKKISRTERIDVVTGSARKGQTYLFWKGDQLFQLPVTYWTDTGSWVNSPSYPDGSPHFDKAVIPRCLECHASYFEWMPPPVNRYRKTSLSVGCDLREVPWPWPPACGPASLEEFASCWNARGDRQSVRTVAGSANGCMRAMPFGEWDAAPARPVVSSRGCARGLHRYSIL